MSFIYGSMIISGGTMSNVCDMVEPYKEPWTKFIVTDHLRDGTMKNVNGTMNKLDGTMNKASGTMYNAYVTPCGTKEP